MFDIISAGVGSRHDIDYVYEFNNGFDMWLMLLTHTKGVFRIDGEDRVVLPDSLILFKPKMPIHYRACEDLYSDDWLHFKCADNDIDDTILPLGIPIHTPLPDLCHGLFRLITAERHLDNEYKNHTVTALIHALIHKLIEAYHMNATTQKHSDLMELRKEIYRYPGENWTLASMAGKVFLSESHLQALYKKTFKVSCINDVINARIQMAKSLLSSTNYTISYISAQCGYNSSQHFFRQFNKVVGCSPNVYRKSLQT